MSSKSSLGNSVTMGQLLEFKVAFPNEEPLTAEQYLKGGSKAFILNVAASFLGFKIHKSEFSDNRKLLGMFFRKENQEFAQSVYDRIKAIEITGVRIGIINSYTSLKLFEHFFSRGEELETQTEAEFERNLFKAYLVLNSDFTNAQRRAFDSTNDLDDLLKVPMMMFCLHYPLADKTNFNIGEIWATQIIKATYLFQYLETSPRTQPLLAAFLKHFDRSTWPDYLKSLIPLTFSAIQNEREIHTDIVVKPGEKFDEDCAFIEKLIVKEADEFEENDFLTTRATPFYKVKDGVYRIIFNLFVVEKIFKGVYFLLRDVNNTLPSQQKVPSLKGIYCHEFSEKTLLYRIMGIIYPDKCLKFTGQQLTDWGIDGAPDYYVRKGKRILLFESKDFLIRADLKASFDYDIYDEEFAKTLYYEKLPNGKEKAGAVMQLISSIKKLLKNDFPADKDHHYKDVLMYPILITHDHQYDTPGLSDLVNSWFQEELVVLKEEGYFVHRIKPLTIINIDTLVYHQVALSKNVSLYEVLDEYHEYIKLKPGLKFKTLDEFKVYRMEKMIPFSLFTTKYFGKMGIKNLPPIMDIVTPSLFREELAKSQTAAREGMGDSE
jgi:hypothetical protein